MSIHPDTGRFHGVLLAVVDCAYGYQKETQKKTEKNQERGCQKGGSEEDDSQKRFCEEGPQEKSASKKSRSEQEGCAQVSRIS